MAGSFADTITSQTMNLDLSKVRGADRRPLETLCTDLFLIVIRMREAEDIGAPDALAKLIRYYLDLFEKNCTVIGMPAGDVSAAKYALVALLDETVLSIPGSCRDYWISSPLQLEYFGDNIAGEEFFRKLDKLLVEPEKMHEILEVFYICLSLGFEGKYRISDPARLDMVIDNLGRIIRRAQKLRFPKISPHGLRSASGGISRGGPVLVPLWIVGLFAASAIIILWAISVFISSSAAADLLSQIR
jgi:type VI secretion system protein ImpK